jgi:DNA-directed RNA polymerase specialized sigma24 family protein
MPDYDFFSDEQLVKASRDGEDAAWEALLTRHGQRFLAFFARMNGGVQAQARERWLALWSELARQRPSLASGPRFSTSAFSLALRLSLAEAPVAQRLPRAEASSLEARSARLHQALAALPALERAALCLGYLDNLPWDELGRVLGCRSEEAKAQCASAYAHLDEALGPDFLSAGLE